MAWTDERVETLKRLWEEGRSASEIAKELGEVTRNAVIGKVHRMGLANRNNEPAAAKPAKNGTEDKPEVMTEVEPTNQTPEIDETPVVSATPTEAPASRADTISPETLEVVEKAEREAKKLTLMQLTERTCKWPIGDPSTDNFWFCGHPSHAGKPYCEAHVELAFQAPIARRDRR